SQGSSEGGASAALRAAWHQRSDPARRTAQSARRGALHSEGRNTYTEQAQALARHHDREWCAQINKRGDSWRAAKVFQHQAVRFREPVSVRRIAGLLLRWRGSTENLTTEAPASLIAKRSIACRNRSTKTKNCCLKRLLRAYKKPADRQFLAKN